MITAAARRRLAIHARTYAYRDKRALVTPVKLHAARPCESIHRMRILVPALKPVGRALLRGTLAFGCLAGCARAPVDFDDWAKFDATAPLQDAAAPDASEEEDADAPTDASDSPLTPPQGNRDAAWNELPDAGPGTGPGSGEDASSPAPQDAGSTPPVMEYECKPGTYAGTFEGEIKIFNFIALPIEGEIAIVAHTSSTGSDLVIENGSIQGRDQDGNPVQAKVEGTLNCATRKLIGGRLFDGTYTRTLLNQTVNFQGTVAATYMPGAVPSVSGTWKTTGGLIEQGEGTFEATFASGP